MLKWAEGPSGQHIELGISEMNLFLLLGQLGLSWDLSGQPLIPIGTVYDPFVLPRPRRVHLRRLLRRPVRRRRHAVRHHAGARGRRPPVDDHRRRSASSCPASRSSSPPTPARSTGCCATRSARSRPAAETRRRPPVEDGAYYLRLTTRPIDQAPFEAARAAARRRGAAPAGARRRLPARRRLRRIPAASRSAPGRCTWPRSGAVMPEVLAAAAELADEGIAAHVVDVTSLDRLYAAWQRTAAPGGAHGDDAARARERCARPSPRRRAGRHRARRRLARDGVAGFGARGAGGPAGRRRLRPVRDGAPSCTSCTTCSPARSSTPRWPRWRWADRLSRRPWDAPAAAASTSGSVRYGIGRARAITVDVRVTPGTASTASTTRWRSALERATTRHSMSPAP